jgi:hypothetical protein
LEFNFVITYKKGTENVRADALSRQLDYFSNIVKASPPLFEEQLDGVIRY